MPEHDRIYIAGAGIAGMSAALALAAKGMRTTVLEKTASLDEVGAGLQLAPNATSLLRKWGLLDSLYAYAVESEGIALKNGHSGATLVPMDVQTASRKYWKAPYITIHRADLQKILKAAIEQNPLIELRTGHEIISCRRSGDTGFEAEVINGTQRETLSGALLLVCDGVWSRLRANLAERAAFSGYIAWRATLDSEQVPSCFQAACGPKTVSAWMGKTGHFISYPLRGGKSCNFVAITRGDNPGPTWSQKGDKSALLACFRQWQPVIGDLVSHVESWTYWPLFQMPFARFTGPSGEVYLGDASHAVTPFAAQGAAMAIEDAAALAEALAVTHLPRAQALTLFERERSTRLKAVARRGDFNRFVYHASGPIALARNLAMKVRPAEKFLTDLDWLYGYDATRFISEAA